MLLTSLPDGYRAAVFGASGAIGAAFVRLLAEDPRCAAVHAGARRSVAPMAAKVRPFQFDLEIEETIAAATESIAQDGPLHLVLIATGVLHDPAMAPEKTWRALSGESLARAFAINASGPALIAKHMIEHLDKDQKSVLAALSARVGSIEDNRLGGWHSYRASKAALHMLMRCFSIELARRNSNALCVCLHPGTVDSALSRPFQRGVQRLFTPEESATHLLHVIDALQAADTGGAFAWDGARIPF